MSTFASAVRQQAPLRVALYGPPGARTTELALEMATTLSNRVALVDTERGAALRYARHDGGGGYLFDHLVLEPQFHPARLVEALASAVHGRYPVVVVDELTPFWLGAGGLHDLAHAAAQEAGSVKAGWDEVRPLERAMFDTLHTMPGDLIVTMRARTTHVVEEDDDGGRRVRRAVLGPEMRDGIEHDFDFAGVLDERQTLTVSASRCPELPPGTRIEKPGAELAEQLHAWASTGEPQPNPWLYIDRLGHITTSAEARELLEELTARRLRAMPLPHPATGEPVSIGVAVKTRISLLAQQERKASQEARREEARRRREEQEQEQPRAHPPDSDKDWAES